MPMRNSAAGLIILTGLLWTPATPASFEMVIVAMETPAWTEHNDTKTAIATGDRIQNGYRLLTGNTGKLALQLEPGVSLQLDVNSEIEFIADVNTETDSVGSQAAVKIHRGRICVQLRARPEVASGFRLLLGDSVSATIHERGEICAAFTADESRIALAEGTVQITNHIDPTMVVLSEPGSEYRFDDSGDFELNMIETEIAIEIGNGAEPVSGSNTQDETSDSGTERADSRKTGMTSDNASGVTGPAIEDTKTGTIYTVYLFSTRSKSVANKVNQELRDAGHQTLIIANDSGAATQYRIAVSGFTSRQAAQDFSAAITGQYGIEDTWVGRKKISE